MTTVQTTAPETAASVLEALDKIGDKFIDLLPIARKMDTGERSPDFARSQILSAGSALYDIRAPQLLNPDRAASRLMAVAGTLSDIQEYYFVEYEIFEDEDGVEYDDPELTILATPGSGKSLLPTEVNDFLNSIKSDIFDVIDMVNPRY
jgi:hypothetical protein